MYLTLNYLELFHLETRAIYLYLKQCLLFVPMLIVCVNKCKTVGKKKKETSSKRFINLSEITELMSDSVTDSDPSLPSLHRQWSFSVP